jgi:hypothetical protein
MVLALVLTPKSSLASTPRGPAGEPALAPPLTPLERIDAALGAAAGLFWGGLSCRSTRRTCAFILPQRCCVRPLPLRPAPQRPCAR